MRQFYLFTDDREISRFLKLRPHLVDLLFEALGPIGRAFSVFVQLHLEVHVEPDGYRSLFVLIVTSQQTTEALACLENLDNDWWLDALPRAQGEMVIALELV